jgi:hypothetical protein
MHTRNIAQHFELIVAIVDKFKNILFQDGVVYKTHIFKKTSKTLKEQSQENMRYNLASIQYNIQKKYLNECTPSIQ